MVLVLVRLLWFLVIAKYLHSHMYGNVAQLLCAVQAPPSATHCATKWYVAEQTMLQLLQWELVEWVPDQWRSFRAKRRVSGEVSMLAQHN